MRYYPGESEAAVIAKRLAGKKGGRPRKALKTARGKKPHALENQNHDPEVSKREAETKGKERKGKVRKGNVKEAVARAPPFGSLTFTNCLE